MAGLSVVAARCRVVENVARARSVETVCEIAEVRFADAEGADGDPLEVKRGVVCEVAAALRVSQMVARPLVETGLGLDRLPLTAVRFVFGSLDWARVSVIETVLGKASDATIRALEFEAVAAAERMGARSLRLLLWRMWMEFDAAEASAARTASVKGERGLSVRQEGGGVSRLQVTMSDVEGAEAEALVEEMVGSVCSQDPRSAKELRVDALVGLLHGEHALVCRCELGEGCPQFGVADLSDGRRGQLVQILIDVQTLLGLNENPAVLADGTALDAEAARILAQDATWQGLLVELASSDVAQAARAARAHTAARPAAGPAAAAADETAQASDTNAAGMDAAADETAQASDTDTAGMDAAGSSGGAVPDGAVPGGAGLDAGTEGVDSGGSAGAPGGGDNPQGEGSNGTGSDGTGLGGTGVGGPGLGLWRLVFRGRIRPAGAVPNVRARRNSDTHDHHGAPRTPRFGGGIFSCGWAGLVGDGVAGARTGSAPCAAGTISGASEEYARTQLIAALTAAIDADPALAAGIYPDGHGGGSEPPAGALTYRPSSDVAAQVRMTYSTCTHPGCERPSTRCELDHIVPFDHKNPRRGGWTIASNLHPVCKGHHQLKTRKAWSVAMLTGGAIVWTSPAGIRAITLPRLGLPTPPRSRKRKRKNAIPDPVDITSPTWWETHMPAGAQPPTRTDLDTAESDTARAKMRDIRRKFREHNKIRKLREHNEPPPY
ncbi:HNH endonuclease [Rhodococcus sp. P1Y]|nr:HNH endonuclease [Rhodococcus sp. P1Y]